MWRRNFGSKYNAHKTVVDGKNFDSNAEAVMYSQLKMMEKAGKIEELETQIAFVLQPGYSLNGKRIRPIVYVADFMFYDTELKRARVLDCKGFKTKEYQLKKKIFDYIHRDAGLSIEENI